MSPNRISYKKIDPFADTETMGRDSAHPRRLWATKKSIRLRILKLMPIAGWDMGTSSYKKIDPFADTETCLDAICSSVNVAATKKSIRLRILKLRPCHHSIQRDQLQKNRSVCGYWNTICHWRRLTLLQLQKNRSVCGYWNSALVLGLFIGTEATKKSIRLRILKRSR